MNTSVKIHYAVLALVLATAIVIVVSGILEVTA
jgi:hypothetical protein